MAWLEEQLCHKRMLDTIAQSSMSTAAGFNSYRLRENWLNQPQCIHHRHVMIRSRKTPSLFSKNRDIFPARGARNAVPCPLQAPALRLPIELQH
jgi:hypothetical protein